MTFSAEPNNTGTSTPPVGDLQDRLGTIADPQAFAGDAADYPEATLGEYFLIAQDGVITHNGSDIQVFKNDRLEAAVAETTAGQASDWIISDRTPNGAKLNYVAADWGPASALVDSTSLTSAEATGRIALSLYTAAVHRQGLRTMTQLRNSRSNPPAVAVNEDIIFEDNGDIIVLADDGSQHDGELIVFGR